VPLSIDVVIPVSGRNDLTASCLTHLATQTRAHAVIVVHSGADRQGAERLREDWPSVQVRHSGAPLGFAAACNRGVAAGRGEVVVVLNNDVDCRADFLEHLLEPLEADSKVGSVACLLLRPGERTIDSAGLTADRTLAGFPRLVGLPAQQAERTRPKLVGPAGAAGAYRRTAFEGVGGLDERIFAYMEDLELALRLRAAGWATAAALRAVGVHIGSATHGRRSRSQRRHFGFGRGYVLRRYGVLRSSAAARTLVTEAAVVAGELIIARDAAAPRGRIEGWKAARGLSRIAVPAEAVDRTIGFGESLALRRGVYAAR
jgi:GT2 family glycosyltransferase